ncbi:MAG TPA: TIGR03118 family protein [Conexibacter sp.]|nr:TIGR03118 family protein [Conexibacter sp.]
MSATRPGRHPGTATSRGRRWSARWLGVLAAVAALGLAGTNAAGAGSGGHHHVFKQRNLVSDIAGVARITDRNLVNPWGLAAGPSTPLWVADNGTNVSTIYSGAVRGGIPVIAPLVVSIPGGAPTGIVYNPTNGFVVRAGTASGPARFIFDSEAGKITAWSPNVPPATQARLEVTTRGAIYKGLAIASTKKKGTRLYAADFHGAKIDVFDDQFHPVSRPGAFTDDKLPAGYAPFNIQELGGRLYVAYAKQDADAEDEVAGAGLGFVDVFDTKGHLIKRLISQGRLNAPWGLAIAPRHFGGLDGDLLVGNFGDGKIHAYDRRSGRFEDQLTNADGNPIQIDGLWALRFGNGTFGTPHGLLFSAGIGDEQHGLLGEIAAH